MIEQDQLETCHYYCKLSAETNPSSLVRSSQITAPQFDQQWRLCKFDWNQLVLGVECSLIVVEILVQGEAILEAINTSTASIPAFACFQYARFLIATHLLRHIMLYVLHIVISPHHRK